MQAGLSASAWPRHTTPPPLVSQTQPRHTHTHTLFFLILYWSGRLCGEKKPNSSVDLWSLSVWLQKWWCHSDAHEAASWTTCLSFTQLPTSWRYRGTLFVALIFSCGGANAVGRTSDTGNHGFRTEGVVSVLSLKRVPRISGDGEEFVHVWLNNPAFLHPRDCRSNQAEHLQRLLIPIHKSIFFHLQTGSTKPLKQYFIHWLTQMWKEQVELTFITFAIFK